MTHYPTIWPGVCLYSASLVALGLPPGELPHIEAEVPAGRSLLNRQQQESVSPVPTRCFPLSWMRPVGIHRLPGGGFDFPTGLHLSHQRKHLHSFCPESSCWAHCRKAVISEAALHRTSVSTCSTELLWREQTGRKTAAPHCQAGLKASPQMGPSSNTLGSSRAQNLRLC